MLLVFHPESSNAEDSSLPRHGAKGAGHVAFAVDDAEIPAWVEYLQTHGIEVEKTIDWPQGGHSVYFRDPAGNSVEIASPLIWQIDKS